MSIILRRLTFTSDTPTYGVFLKDDQPLVVTLELPWKENAPDISCIAPGTYQVIPHNSPEHQNVWEVTGVTHRNGILLHEGNSIADSKGCILVGTTFAQNVILESVDALNYLRKILPSSFTLTVVNP